MEALTSVVSLPLRALVIGLQATTFLALGALSLCLIIAMLWNKVWVQNIIQTIAKYIPVNTVLHLSKLQKVEISPKIDADHCSICYCDIDKEVLSSCGHIFCGKFACCFCNNN